MVGNRSPERTIEFTEPNEPRPDVVNCPAVHGGEIIEQVAPAVLDTKRSFFGFGPRVHSGDGDSTPPTFLIRHQRHHPALQMRVPTSNCFGREAGEVDGDGSNGPEISRGQRQRTVPPNVQDPPNCSRLRTSTRRPRSSVRTEPFSRERCGPTGGDCTGGTPNFVPRSRCRRDWLGSGCDSWVSTRTIGPRSAFVLSPGGELNS